MQEFKFFFLNFQGGYDGTHFLANVEVYDPVKDDWEDGVSLTSGRSGLASAVIYQPSCHQSYSLDCITNLSSDREYDDDRKPPDGPDDETDLSSRGTSSMFHFNCSTSNFFSGSSGNQRDEAEPVHCELMRRGTNGELFSMLKEVKVKIKENCSKAQTSDDRLHQVQLSDSQIAKQTKLHAKCKYTTCPLQTLKRRFQHFIFSSRDRNSCEKLCKSKGKWCVDSTWRQSHLIIIIENEIIIPKKKEKP